MSVDREERNAIAGVVKSGGEILIAMQTAGDQLPVRLDIVINSKDLVPVIGGLRTGCQKVAARTTKIRVGVDLLQSPAKIADAAGWNDVAGEWDPCGRVKRNGLALAIITGAFERSRNGGGLAVEAGQIARFISEKCEQLILFPVPHFGNKNRAAQGVSVIVIARPGIVPDNKSPGGEFVAQEEFVSTQVEILGAAARDEVDLPARAAAEFRSVAAGVDLYFFNEVDSENVVDLNTIANAVVADTVQRDKVVSLRLPLMVNAPTE